MKSKSIKPIYAFIDSQNLNLGIKQQGWKLDFKKFRIYLTSKYRVHIAYLFIGYISTNYSLYKKLRSYGYLLVFKPAMTMKNGKIKGNVDAELVLQTMVEYNKFSTAIIITGDGDFSCLVNYLANQNKLEYLFVPDINKYSGLLKKASKGKILFMNKLRNKLSQ